MGTIPKVISLNLGAARSRAQAEVCRNACGVSSIGAARRWPAVTPLGLK
jgi:hypothetical protein